MDFREFISILENEGYLKKVNRNVNWKYEIGAIARENKHSPVLFNNIRDYPGCALFTGGLSRVEFIAMNAGLSAHIKEKKLISVLKQRIRKTLPPVIADNSDQFKMSETKEVNLHKLPVPWWHPSDGGRYVGTWHLNITNDPTTGKRNVGVYRMQILNSHNTTVSVSPDSHLAFHVRNAERMGKDLEMGVAIGVSEVTVIAAAAAIPFGVDEFAVAGSIRGEPLRLRPCRDINVQVPDEVEYVIEGRIKKGIRVTDGPYMDYAGKQSINPSAFLFEVSSISQRLEPIFRGMSVGCPGAEDHQLFHILSHLNLVNFHGSSVRQKVQNLLLKYRLFDFFQYSGRLGKLYRS